MGIRGICSPVKKLQRSFKQILSLFLIGFLVFHPAATLAEDIGSQGHPAPNSDYHDPAPQEQNMAALAMFAKAVREGENLGGAVDNFNLLDQELRLYVDGPDSDPIVYSLAEDDPNRPAVRVADIQNQVELIYDADAAELKFQLKEGKGKRVVVVAEHVIRNVHLTTHQGQHFVRDENMILFSSDRGVRALFWPLTKQALFNGPVPDTLIMSGIEAVNPHAQITGVSQFQSVTQDPVKWENTSNEAINRVKLGDVFLEVQLPEGKIHLRLDYQKQVLPALSLRLLHLLFQLELVDPSHLSDPEFYKKLQDLITSNQQGIMEVEESKNALLEGSTGLTAAALLNVGRDIDRKGLWNLLLPQGKSGNAFEAVQNSPQYSLGYQEWVETHQKIKEGPLADGEFWADKVAAEVNHREPELAAAVDHVEGLTERSTGKILGIVGSIPAPRLMALGVALAAAEVATGGQVGPYALQVFTNLFEFTNHLPRVPLVSAVADKIGAKSSYYENAYSAVQVMGAIAALISLRPIGMWVVHKLSSTFAGKDFGFTRTFFYWGVKLYAYAAYPAQKLILWDFLFGQKNLYTAMEKGISPFESASAWHIPRWIPWLGKRSMEKSREQISAQAAAKATRSSRAMILAAAIVAHQSEATANPIDPASILGLLEARERGESISLAEFIEKNANQKEWFELAARVDKELKRLHDKGIGDLDLSKAGEYLKVAEEAHKKLNSSSPLQRGIGSKIAQAAKSFKSFTTERLLPFVFMGSQSYGVFKRYKGLLIDQRNSDTAAQQFKTDYDLSTLVYGAFDPVTFGSASTMQPKAVAEVVPNQVEQGAIWGMQGPIDAMETYRARVDLWDPSAAFWAHRFPFHISEHENGLGRANSTLVDAKDAAIGIFDPEKDATLLGTQFDKMRAHIEGFQTRMLQGFVPRVVGFTLLAMVSMEAASLFDTMAQGWVGATKAFPAQLNFNFSKYAVILPSFMIGYAVIWGPVTAFTNYVKSKALKARGQLVNVFAEADEALRHKDDSAIDRSVQKLRRIFMASLNLKGILKKDSNGYLQSESNLSREEARSFFNWALKNSPSATLTDGESVKFIEWLNRAGVAVSVLLYVGLSNATNQAVQEGLASGNAEVIWGMALKNMGWFFATMLGTYWGAKGFDKISKWRIKNKCSQAMSDLANE